MVVHNSEASAKVERVSLPLPVCAVRVSRLVGGKRSPVAAQVNAQFSISDAVPPYFDFSLHFEVSLPAFGTATFLLDPIIDGTCGGGDLDDHQTHYAPHEQCMSSDKRLGDAVDRVAARVLKDAAGWSDHTPKPLTAPPPPPSPPLPPVVTLENQCLRVWIDTKFGLQAAQDLRTGKNYSLHHELIRYDAVINDAYHAEMAGAGTPFVASSSGAAAVQKSGALDATVAKGAL